MWRAGRAAVAWRGWRAGHPAGRPVVAVMILMCCLFSAGCTPRQISITAIFLDGGYPTAVFHPCRGTHIDGISVIEEIPTSDTGPRVGNVWEATDPANQPVGQIRLLAIPPGWVLQTTKPGSLLTAFAADRRYWVRAQTTDTSSGNDAGVEFTLGDLRSLSEGEVWATPEPFAQPRAMTSREFARHAAASC
jgi:hypothetical protein